MIVQEKPDKSTISGWRKAVTAAAAIVVLTVSGGCAGLFQEAAEAFEKGAEPTRTAAASQLVEKAAPEPTATPEPTPKAELTDKPPTAERFVEFEAWGEVDQGLLESSDGLPNKTEEELLSAMEGIGLELEEVNLTIIERKDGAGKVWHTILVGEKASGESMYLERLWLYAEVNEAQTQYMLPGEGVEGRLIPIGFKLIPYGFTYQVEGEKVGPAMMEGQSLYMILYGLGYGEEGNFQWVREVIKLDLQTNQIYYTDPWTGEQYQLKEETNRGILASIIPAEAQLFPGLPIEAAREALSKGWIMDLDEEGNWVVKNEEGKVRRVWNKEAQEWKKLLPFEVNLERGEFRAMSKQEVEIIRQGLKDKERAAELKDGNGFIMRLPETGQLIAVVCPKIMKIGDLEDPKPDLYPDYRDIDPGILDEILMGMRPELEGENWDDMVEDGRTANLIVVQVSFITEGMSNSFMGAGHWANTAIDEEVLPNTAVHLLMIDRSDYRPGGMCDNMAQERFVELMETGLPEADYRKFPRAKFDHGQTQNVVLNVANVIVMGQYPAGNPMLITRNLNKNARMVDLLWDGYPFYVRVEGLNY